jgi:hypothetical protein
MRHFLAVAGILLLMVATLATRPSQGLAEERLFAAHHRTFSFSFLYTGNVASKRKWPQEMSPRKFTMEIVLNEAGAEMSIMVFALGDRSTDWWLAEVMGFLFVAEVSGHAALTAQGYESFELSIPGGHGVDQQTELLVAAHGVGFRITCLRCEAAGATEALRRLADSLVCDLDDPAVVLEDLP